MDIKIEPKSKLGRKAFSLMTVIVIAVFGFVYLSGGSNGARLKVDKQRLKFDTVKMGVFHDYIPVRATVMPIETVYLDVVQGGSVEEIFVEEGSFVKKGEALARLNNTQLQLDVISREAEVSEQLNSLRNTRLAMEQNLLDLKERLLEMDYEIAQDKRRLRKGRKLIEVGGFTEDELVAIQDRIDYLTKKRTAVHESLVEQQRIRKGQLRQLENSAQQLEKNLAIAGGNLESLTIKSSINGQLSSFEIKVGQSLSASERIGQVDDTHAYKLQAYIDEFYINQIAIGQDAKFELNDVNYLADVKKISSEINNGQFKVELYFRESGPKGIRRGQTIKLRLSLDEPSQSLLVKSGSYMQDTGGNWLFVVGQQGSWASKRSVRTGRTNPDYIEILEGVEEGEKIVTSSYREFINYDQLIISN